MIKNTDFVTNSFAETQTSGEKIAKDLKGGEVLALYGDLGSGKTTFVQGLAKGLGLKRRIISPTFVIVRSYKLRVIGFYHIDLYRLQSEKDIEDLGIKEIISNPENIVAVEWAEKMKKILPKNRIDIKFEYLEKNKRKIAVECI